MATPQSIEDKSVFIQIELNETTDIMKKNIETMIEHGDKIQMLEVKTDELKKNSGVFKNSSQKLKRNMCCQHYRVITGIVLVMIVVLLVIVVPIAVKYTN